MIKNGYWMFCPSSQKKQQPTKIVDWSKRDQEYVVKIKRLYKELLKLEKSVRITLSLIGRQFGILANLERHLDKLPKTERLLSEITESVQQFQIRRCCIVIDRMIMKDEPVILWKVQRIAAMKSHHFYEIKPYLENYVQQKQDVKNDEQTTS
ncbi:TnsD family Tn7-like transposition protein [Metabacillus niabensis]|uniref:TnsD family Tn7-like transposition protein n=1 Tax=Metabacillus niabensis TaxID=324854 RepID=UPI0021F55A8E|nr:TnsD family Tn7-like transposition protein [Metabacillus niabensis]